MSWFDGRCKRCETAEELELQVSADKNIHFSAEEDWSENLKNRPSFPDSELEGGAWEENGRKVKGR